jgi:orotate phosphoribosyltransferase
LPSHYFGYYFSLRLIQNLENANTRNSLVIFVELMKKDKQTLIKQIKSLCVRSGEEFTLASGEKSKTYIDIKKIAQHQKYYRLLAKLLANKIKAEFNPIDAVAGVVLGGCHLASIVAMQCPTNLNIIFVRKEAKEHGSKNLIEQPARRIDESVVLLEDVITTGSSALKAAILLTEEGYVVKGIVAVVDRRISKEDKLGGFKVVSLVDYEDLL